MPAEQRIQMLTERLRALNPTHLEIIDESHMHIGHEGAKDGAGHFRVIIASEQFKGLAPLGRHRLVYELVDDLIPYPIHALAIQAKPNP
ncbi:MAG TPA: BolA family protein [Burkholderiaceae bacterium]|nr:BolA family protein [Burkholderiaceae bacterium]